MSNLRAQTLTRPTNPLDAGGSGDWREAAACLDEDPELFYPPEGSAGTRQAAAAQAVCRRCDVRDTCLANATGERFGVWGGVRRG